MSVHWPIIKSLLRRPSRIATVDDRRQTKAVELFVAACHVADAIAARCRSQTVGVMLPTSGAAPVAMLAGWMLGKTVVPLNYLLKPAELQYVIDDCGADTIVTAQPMLDFLSDGGGWPAGERPRVQHTILLDALSFRGVPDLRWPSSRGAGASADELAVLLYTSGTSGKPKGVMLSHANLSANVRQCVEWVQFDHSDVILGVLPQFHSFGLTVLTILPLSVGCKVVYTARFVPAQIVRLMRTHRPTAFIGIPSMYNALLAVKDAAPEDFASLKYTVSGGEPLPAVVSERFFERFGVRINEGYGLTETSPVTNWCRPWEFQPRAVGKPLPRIDQRIVDPATGRSLGPNQDGEVWIKGPNVMRGYYHLPQETAAVLTPDGFLRTGDMGRFDDQGRLYITGRIKEMIIVGGENVFPREIEEALEKHPAVNACGVVGLVDEIRGETPVAFVELREGQTATEKELRSWCRERLAGYKVPGEVRFLEKLPRNPTGKVMRRELKAMLAAPGQSPR